MVIKSKLPAKTEGASILGGPSRKEIVSKRDFALRRDSAQKRNHGFPQPRPPNKLQVDLAEPEPTVDVIDLGAPRALRPPRRARAPPARRLYTPNPRLYPGPAPKPKPKRRSQSSGRVGRGVRRRVFRRPVPNARLYRPAPRRLPPPPQPPRGPWPPPPPARALDTASRAALRLAAQRPPPPPPRLPQRAAFTPAQRSPVRSLRSAFRYTASESSGRGSSPVAPPPSPPPRARRLVVTLPAASGRGAGAAAAAMDAARRSSPDDYSDNDALSAPSEFLAEFLSAIMRRQHAEALKYCRLILQYEPHNATARGFYPLLQHKVHALKRNEGAAAAGCAGGGSSSSGSPPRLSPRSHSRSADSSRSPREDSVGARCRRGHVVGSRSRSGSESGGSVASQSSLELDSSSGGDSGGGGSGGDSGARSDSASGTRSRSEPDSSDARDDNGNVPPPAMPRPDDVENDNDVPHIKESSAAALRRLRAQFACSIK